MKTRYTFALFILLVVAPLPCIADGIQSIFREQMNGDELSEIQTTLSSAGGERKKTAQGSGTYSGTLILKKTKRFSGFTCDPTQSFPAIVTVSQTGKRISASINNLPSTLTGKAKKKFLKAKTSVSLETGVKRSYTMTIRKIRDTSATIQFVELVRQNGRRGCLFRHVGQFSRN